MKLKINKACDLNSISVLPPRRTNVMSSVADGLGRSQASQIRSQSQQSFSQGLSQLSQSSFDENLINEQRFGSQEKENCAKRIPALVPIASTREETQLQLAKTSNSVMHRWNAVPYSGQANEEFERKFRLLEGSINRVAMILDTVQSDVMQVNRAVKEVTLESVGIRQKINLLENSVQQMVQSEHDLKSSLEGHITCISSELTKNSNCDKLNEVLSAVKALPEQIETRLAKVEHEVQRVFAKQEAMMTAIKHSNNKPLPNIPLNMKNYADHHQPLQNPTEERKVSKFVSASSNYKRSLIPSIVELKPKAMELKYTDLQKQHKEIPLRKQEPIMRIIIDSDEESNAGPQCFLVKKETGNENRVLEDVQDDAMKILMKARKRRRRQRNTVFVV